MSTQVGASVGLGMFALLHVRGADSGEDRKFPDMLDHRNENCDTGKAL